MLWLTGVQIWTQFGLGKLPRLIQEALGCSGRAEGQFEYCDDRLLVQRISSFSPSHIIHSAISIVV